MTDLEIFVKGCLSAHIKAFDVKFCFFPMYTMLS